MLNCFKIIIILLLIAPAVQAQKKNSVKESKILAITEYKQDVEKKGAKLMENYTLYDINGNTLEEIEYDSFGKIKSHMKYQYDTNNNRLKELELNTGGKIVKTIEYKYVNNLKVEKNIYDSSGKLKSKRFYQYEFQK